MKTLIRDLNSNQILLKGVKKADRFQISLPEISDIDERFLKQNRYKFNQQGDFIEAVMNLKEGVEHLFVDAFEHILLDLETLQSSFLHLLDDQDSELLLEMIDQNDLDLIKTI